MTDVLRTTKIEDTDSITHIKVYSKVPFKNDFENVIYFKNRNNMNEFFESDKVTLLYESETGRVLDKDGSIVLTGTITQFEKANYLQFKNYEGRTYYAFIFDCIYLNKDTVRLIYEIDVFNTYQFLLFKEDLRGHIEQLTLRNEIKYLSNSQQGFAVGTRQPVYSRKLENEIEFLVIVGKPSFKFGEEKNQEEKLNNFTFSGTQKNLRYFIVPILPQNHNTLPFSIGDKDYKGYSLSNLYTDLAGIGTKVGDDSNKTVNNIVNMFITKNCGLNYEWDGQKVVFKDPLPSDYEVLTEGFSKRTSKKVNKSIGDIKEDDSTIESRIVSLTKALKSVIPNATAEGIAGIVGCFARESSVTAKRYEADYATGYAYDKMEQEPTAENLMGSWSAFRGLYSISLNEGGYNVGGKHWIGVGLGQFTGGRCKALYDYCKQNNKSIFSFSGQVGFMTNADTGSYPQILTNIATSTDSINNNTTNFLAQWEGVPGDHLGERIGYANQYYPLIKETLDNFKSDEKSDKEQNKDNVIPAPLTQPKNVENALQETRNHLGQGVGIKYGTYQCYGFAAHYVKWLGSSIGLGHDVGVNKRLKGGLNASDIGEDYDWASEGFVVDYNITPDKLKNNVGAIICIKSNYGAPIWTGEYGHVSVVSGYEDGYIKVFEQNAPAGTPISEHKYPIDSFAGCVKSLIIPPEIAGTGYSLDGKTSTDVVSAERVITSALIFIKDFQNFSSKEFEIPNLLKVTYDEIQKRLKNLINTEMVEIQLLNSEFCEIEIFDYYGNSYLYQPNLFPRNLDPDYHYKIVQTGSLGDNNQVHVTFNNYNNLNSLPYANFDVKDVTPDKYAQFLPEIFKYGYSDIVGKNLTILNDNIASYMQANSHQYSATQLTFKENKEMQNRQANLSTKQVNLANEQATYNSDYAIQSAKISTVATGVTALGETLGNALSLNFGGAIKSGISGGFNTFNAFRDLGNKEQQGQFTNQQNYLRSQSNNLSNMQAKQSLNQSIRAYNASLSDLANQPISVQSMGNDLSYQTGNGLNSTYYKISVPQDEILVRAYNYIKLYGVIVNIVTSNILDVCRNNRRRFNYIKVITADVTNLPINISHQNSLLAIFQTGVRIWNYENIKNETKIFDYDKDNPNI